MEKPCLPKMWLLFYRLFKGVLIPLQPPDSDKSHAEKSLKNAYKKLTVIQFISLILCFIGVEWTDCFMCNQNMKIQACLSSWQTCVGLECFNRTCGWTEGQENEAQTHSTTFPLVSENSYFIWFVHSNKIAIKILPQQERLYCVRAGAP